MTKEEAAAKVEAYCREKGLATTRQCCDDGEIAFVSAIGGLTAGDLFTSIVLVDENRIASKPSSRLQSRPGEPLMQTPNFNFSER